MTITAEMIKKAISDMSDYNQYAGCKWDEYVFTISSDSPEKFDLVPTWSELPEYVEHCDLSDLAEEVAPVWVPAVVDGDEAFVLIYHDSIAFMRVPADKDQINWID